MDILVALSTVVQLLAPGLHGAYTRPTRGLHWACTGPALGLGTTTEIAFRLLTHLESLGAPVTQVERIAPEPHLSVACSLFCCV